MVPVIPPNTRVIRLPQVIELTGLSRSSIYAAVKRGVFPAPIRLGIRAVGWRCDAVEEWLSERPSTRSCSTSS
jgi:prophage regulatory protein